MRWQPGEPAPEGPSTGLQVVIVGIDGADWFLMGKLLEQGRLPTINGLLQRGQSGEVAANLPFVPEMGWTQLGRGRALTEEQTMHVAVGGRLYGIAPELAELVQRAGGRAVSVGWPASWPVGDTATTSVAGYRPATQAHELGLPPTVLRGGTSQASSGELAEFVDTVIERNEASCEAEFRRLIFDGEPSDAQWAERLLAARWAFLSDAITSDLAASLIADVEPDVALVCFGGLDAVVHRFLSPAMPDFFPGAPPEESLYEEVLASYYDFIDGAIERLRRLTDENTVFIICSVYGTHPSPDAPGASASHSNGPPGVLIVRGANIPRRARTLSVATVDLAPTVLAMLGMEVPSSADGRVVTDILPTGLLEKHPLAYSDDDGRAEPAGTPDVAAMDRLVAERMEFLRAGMGG